MSDLNPDPLPDLPPELAELDRELLEIRIEQRPSFAPELEAELERAWAAPALAVELEPAGAGRRLALVAGLSLIILVTGAVPQARASLVELSRQALISVGVIPEPRGASLLPQDPEVTILASEAWSEDAAEAPSSSDPAPDPAPEEPVVEEIPPYPVLSVTFPQLTDRAADEAAIRRYYPEELQRQRVGGATGLRLWVDDEGRVGQVEVGSGSGVPALDRAARQAARELRFTPATRNGEAVGTWVEFEMVFDPRAADGLPSVSRVGPPVAPDIETSEGRSWEEDAVVSPPLVAEARELLRTALGPANPALARLGSVDRVLAAEPPPGVAPLPWRSEAARALREAIARDPDNPAPYLALGRILRQQGLRDEAGDLFRRGLGRTERGVRPVSPRLVAELNYELGLVLQEGWRPWIDLGSLDLAAGTESLPPCVRERAERLSADRVSVLGFVCPEDVDRLLEASFVPVTPEEDLRAGVIAAFEAAVARHPSHPGANTDLLLELAREGAWYDVLNGARRFAWASEGHANALLLSGLALQRLGRSEEAMEEFRRALWSVSSETASALRDPGPLLSADSLRAFRALDEEARDEARAAFWASRDPILSTPVNEREVEHLARAAEAILRFGSVETDAGSVWVRYGAPRRIRTLGEGTHLRTEFWDYGSGPDATFRRMATSEDRDLTREAATYLNDLRRVFPHTYGSRGRPIVPLAAQAARFGGPTGEVVVRSTVPGGLATGGADSLEVGVFLLDRSGVPRNRFRKRIPARVAPVEVEAPLEPGTVAVVLELWHPGRAEAATVRMSLPANAPRPRVSDLMLVEPVEGVRAPESRYDPRLVPLPSDRLAEDRVGVLFEVYDPVVASPHVRITARAVPEGGGLPLPLATQSSWPRQLQRGGADAGGTVDVRSVYATVDLSTLPTGPWELRVSVESAENGDRVEASRSIQRLSPVQTRDWDR